MSGQGEENPDAGREKGRLLDKLKTGLEAMFAAQDDPSRGVNVDCESEDNETSAPNEPSERERQETVEAVLKIDTSATVVEINNIRLFSMDEVKLEKLTQCVSLSLRKNLIHDLVPLPEALANRLEELDLFDNKIRKLKGFFDTVRVPGEPPTVKQAVGAFQCITKLDLSYNQIREIGLRLHSTHLEGAVSG
ncbi:hypothetical protein ERJ75_000441000 [Trypanosoma vivax]|nr:hypothetical protein ERJ75_000441000 [Trypanosoma vivax]